MKPGQVLKHGIEALLALCLLGMVICVFGNVLLRKIDGEHYRQPIPYQIKCPGLVAQNSIWKMRLTFKGSAADFNPALLRTSVSGLAIKLFQPPDPPPAHRPARPRAAPKPRNRQSARPRPPRSPRAHAPADSVARQYVPAGRGP